MAKCGESQMAIDSVLGQTVVLASGMLVHEASVILVILNAMRLLAYRPPERAVAQGLQR